MVLKNVGINIAEERKKIFTIFSPFITEDMVQSQICMVQILFQT